VKSGVWYASKKNIRVRRSTFVREVFCGAMASEDLDCGDISELCDAYGSPYDDEERAAREEMGESYSTRGGLPPRKRAAVRGSGYSDDESQDEDSSLETSISILNRCPNQEHAAQEFAHREAKRRAKPAPFRCRGKAFFLTYPQCDVPLTDILTHMQRIFGIDDIAFVRIASEKHADGSLHRHVFLTTREAKAFFSPTFADLVERIQSSSGHTTKRFHGNYQVAKSQIKSYEYVSKKGEFIDFGTVPSGLAHKSIGKLDTVATAIEGGATSKEIRDQYKGFYLMNKRKVDTMVAEYALEKAAKTTVKWDVTKLMTIRDELSVAGAHDSTLAVVDWLMKNIDQTRKFKQKQLYLVSPPNHGKTTLVQILSKFVSVFDAPMGESFFDQFDESVHKLVFFDEFKGQHTVTFMNKFLEMSVMNMKVKGSQILRTKNMPVIIGSNLMPHEAYHRVHETDRGADSTLGPILAGFAARVEVVQLTEPLFMMLKRVMTAFNIVDETLDVQA